MIAKAYEATMCPLACVSAQALEPIEKAIQEIYAGFNRNYYPSLCSEGTSGTYLLYNSQHNPIAVFKPVDEEAFAPNNPRGFIGEFGHISLRSASLLGKEYCQVRHASGKYRHIF